LACGSMALYLNCVSFFALPGKTIPRELNLTGKLKF
jgi:hypothetical protein